MKASYKIVFIVATLLVILSLSLSVINYTISLKNAQEQLKNQSLPLSLDNIYTDIQKHIIEPYLVSSMMAHDTFVKDWLIHDEDDRAKIIKYLNTIKNKYKMFSTFLVSETTKNYYTQNGFIEKVQKGKANNEWYFDFKNSQNSHEINLDFNEKLANSMIMFVNYKIYDDEFQMIGATGIALKISYINEMLKKFRLKYNFIVTFYNQEGRVVLSEKDHNPYGTIKENGYIKAFQDKIISKESHLIEYEKEGKKYIIKTKYIPELNLYLSVEAKLEALIKEVKKVFYFNLIISLTVTLIVSLIILYVIRRHQKRLTYLAEHDDLTNIANRRVFEERFNYLLLLEQREKKPLSLLFLDIDDFKKINDILGHHIGDLVLQQVASILQSHIRRTDILARWGGEEFIIGLVDSDLEAAKSIGEKLRISVSEDFNLKSLTKFNITISAGVTQVREDDTMESILNRADTAMYKSKKSGKDRITAL